MKRLARKIVFKLYGSIENFYWKTIYQNYRKNYSIHKDFKFNGHGILFYGDGIVSCGKRSYIGSLSFLQASKNCKIIIGDNCAISHNVKIYTESYDPDQDFNNEERKTKLGDVIIGNAAWIGANVLINPGITIGDNAVVGANSVVTRDVPPFAIVGGVPAKSIRNKNLV